GRTGRPPVGDADLLEAHPPDHAAEEAVALRHLSQSVRHPAADQAEVTRIESDRRIAHARQEPIEQAGGPELEAALPRSIDTHTVGDVVPLAPAGDEVANRGRGILQVGVDYHDRVTRSVVDPGCDRDL